MAVREGHGGVSQALADFAARSRGGSLGHLESAARHGVVNDQQRFHGAGWYQRWPRRPQRGQYPTPRVPARRLVSTQGIKDTSSLARRSIFNPQIEGAVMLYSAVVFFMISLIAAFLVFGGIADGAAASQRFFSSCF